MKSIALLGFVLIGTFSAFAQSLSQDWTEMEAKIKNASNIEMKTVVRAYYLEEKEWKQAAEKKVSFSQKGKNRFYQIDDLHILINEKIYLTIDHKNKEMAYQFLDSKKNALTVYQPYPNIDSLIKTYQKVQFVSKKGYIKHYRIEVAKPQKVYIDIYLDMENGWLQKVLYEYPDEKVKSEAIMEYVSFRKNVASALFDEKKYLLKTKDSYVAQPAYKQYIVEQI
jgi:hypothetical protein